jgi:hypothetical protein
MEIGFKSFVTENEIEERRKVRQQEWDQTRTEDQPLGKVFDYDYVSNKSGSD